MEARERLAWVRLALKAAQTRDGTEPRMDRDALDTDTAPVARTRDDGHMLGSARAPAPRPGRHTKRPGKTPSRPRTRAGRTSSSSTTPRKSST